MIRLGDWELFPVSDGAYHMDGGAFFGVVPKTMWNRKLDADGENRIRAGLNCLVARRAGLTLLIETGIGEKLDEKWRAIHGIERSRSLPEDIARHGIDPDSIDIVINTHLHFDHCGGNTRWQEGNAVPVFPRAHYYAQRGEWEHAHLRLERDRVSYLDENYDPLVESGRMTLLTGNTEIAPGVRVEVWPGHTRYMQIVLIESDEETCAFLGDLIPSTAHLSPTWVMAYDLFPLESIESKKQVLARAVAEQWICLFVHDALQPYGYVRAGKRGKFDFGPLKPAAEASFGNSKAVASHRTP